MGQIASTPLWQLGNRDLVARLTAVHRRILRDYAEYFAILSEVDGQGTAYELGYGNTAALLVHTQNISRSEANQRIAQATALHDVKTPTGAVIEASLPLTAAKLAAGEISVGQVEVIRKFVGSLD
ncbi:hypothetical protein GC106_36250, partial [Kibdelosporangium sp. 4NS15]